MSEFFTISFLATYAGAAMATGLVTQFLKFLNIPTQLLSYIIALMLLMLTTSATGAASAWTDWAIVPFNAVLVSLASNGAYDGIVRIKGGD